LAFDRLLAAGFAMISACKAAPKSDRRGRGLAIPVILLYLGILKKI
jgi:hypothetical protein